MIVLLCVCAGGLFCSVEHFAYGSGSLACIPGGSGACATTSIGHPLAPLVVSCSGSRAFELNSDASSMFAHSSGHV
ncbi:hypothetical protein EDC04DRAFT_343388 [Pisolithus marmoratus]|nr:hypothetical protein EDC04DRAFT_343388 [Pisolithus marmoratus]